MVHFKEGVLLPLESPLKRRSVVGFSSEKYWMQLLESGRDVCVVFYDFKKAFDSVPHCELIDKLRNINVGPVLLHWIQNYLSGRRQQVLVKGETSETLPVLYGVLQGSVIGPLLFLVYSDGTLPLSDGSHLTLCW